MVEISKSVRINLRPMQKIMAALILVDLTLVGLTLLRFSGAGVGSAAPVTLILILSGVAFKRIKISPDVRPTGLKMGIAAGVVLAGEVVLEYILLPKDNSKFGTIEYGLFLLILFLAGVIAYTQYRSLKASAMTGLWTGLFGSLTWYAVVLLIFHLFWDTAAQTQVFQAEGNFDDFTRSGMTDFAAFIAQDFFGAGFFHLLIGGVIGLVVGWIGGLVRSLVRTRAASYHPPMQP
jgi:hypothetical protein